jgi:hypothetical protein
LILEFATLRTQGLRTSGPKNNTFLKSQIVFEGIKYFALIPPKIAKQKPSPHFPTLRFLLLGVSEMTQQLRSLQTSPAAIDC